MSPNSAYYIVDFLTKLSAYYYLSGVYYIGKNVTKFDILHRRLSHRIVSVLLPYSGVTTGFFHGGWAPFSKNYNVKVKSSLKIL